MNQMLQELESLLRQMGPNDEATLKECLAKGDTALQRGLAHDAQTAANFVRSQYPGLFRGTPLASPAHSVAPTAPAPAPAKSEVKPQASSTAPAITAENVTVEAKRATR